MGLALANAQMFDARTRMAERQTLLYGVLRAVGGRLDAGEVARQAVEAIARDTTWSHVIVALPHADGTRWTFEVSSRPPFVIESMPLDAGVIGRAHRLGRTQVVHDVAADPDYVDALGGTRSEVAAPIQWGDRTLGVFDIESTEPHAFGPDDVALAESLADALALALETVRLYQELAQKHERLREAERMRDDLTHSMVHDLKNPLTTISAVVEGLDMGLAPEAARERHMLEVAQRGIKKMAILLDAILDVSQLESGQMPLARDRVRLTTLFEDLVRLQTPLAEAKGITLETESPEAPTAWADPSLTGRVLQNLVGNALKFTPRGGRILVRAFAAGDQVRVVVSDSGPGIPPEVRDRLFQKFAAAGPGQGSGLGLAFCRLAVEAQGGRIWVETDPEHGATFTFTLPTAA
jgi:signal transduction histidine kinase